MTRVASVLMVLSMAAGVGWAGHAAAEPALHGPTGALGDAIAEAGGQLPSAGNRGYVAVPAEAFSAPADPVISKTIFVNRCRGGCSFTKATLSDALSNQTIIGPLPVGTRFTLSEFAYSDDIWNQTIACVRSVYAPFGVNVVTDDPGNTAHHEAVLAGRSTEAGYPPNQVLGVAPLDSSTCRPQNNVVSFSFANDHGASPLDMCWTVAQESAHAFGLDHEFECSDPMTYIPLNGCGGFQKYFRNLDAPCGENAARSGICGGNTQNSYKRLLGVHGPGTATIPPPVVDITMPRDGATGLPASFSVYPTAVDPRGLNHLELWINGWKWAEVPGVWQKTSVYVMNLPPRVPDGVMDIKVKGCGDTGVCGEDNITVTRGQACTSAASCLEGQKCEQGKCFWDPPSVEFGDECEYSEQCLSGSCASVDGVNLCTSACVSGPNDRCPENYECHAPTLGAQGFCGAPLDEGGGCCSTGGSPRGALAVNLGLGTMIGLLVARRRRRAA